MKPLIFALLISCLSHAQEGQHAPLSAPAKAEISQDRSKLSLVIGPLRIPTPAEFPLRIVGDATIPSDGWIIGSSQMLEKWPTDVRVEGTIAAQVVNLERQDLLCKAASERFASFGEGWPSWPELKEFGYRVHKGDRIQVQLLVQMRGADSVTLELEFQPFESGPFRRDAYPMWFNSRGCGPAEFDLKAGKNISSGTFEIPATGTLAALQGGLRENAEYIEVVNRSREATFLHQQWNGPDHPLPLITPKAGAEFRVDQGDFVAVAAGYNNPEISEAKNAAIGVALGVFVPLDDAKMAQWAK